MIYGNSQFNDFLDSFFTQRMSSPSLSTSYFKETNMDYDINYTKDGAYLIYEVPGFNKSNLKVELEDDLLFIRGKRTYKLNDKEVTKEINQKFRIGDRYSSSQVEATIEDGILSIFVPNMKKEDKKRINLL
jgi:HSP20 family molecular chaperone IbpA